MLANSVRNLRLQKKENYVYLQLMSKIYMENPRESAIKPKQMI
jgi:hypothetical protein